MSSRERGCVSQGVCEACNGHRIPQALGFPHTN